MPCILEATAVIFRSSRRAKCSAAKKGAAPPRGACGYSSSKLPGRAWGHTGHNKGHSESLTWHLSSVNAALDLASSSIFMGGVQTEAQEWEAGIQKRKLMDCWDVPDAETLRRKETGPFKLYFFDSEELWVGLGGRMAIDISILLSLSVPCTLSTPCMFHLFLEGVFCERIMWLFLPCHIHWCRRETQPESYFINP